MKRRWIAMMLTVALSVSVFSAAFPVSQAAPVTQGEATNIAKGKPVTADAGAPGVITDGNIDNFWDGGVAPAEFMVDLEAYYDINKIVVYPYFEGVRYYHYTISVSADRLQFTEVAKKTNNNQSVRAGDSYTISPTKTARYVLVRMTHNSANPSVHMNEIEVYGTMNKDYVPPSLPDQDKTDPKNIAFKKPVRANVNNKDAGFVNDAIYGTKWYTAWTSKFFPSVVDIDLEQEYDLTDMTLYLPYNPTRFYYYTLYGSNDGETFDELYVKKNKDLCQEDGDKIDLTGQTYRIIRTCIQYVSDSSVAMICEINMHGTATGKNKGILRKGSFEEITQIEEFSQTEYSAPITTQETIENVYGIVERTVGSEYRAWFDFQLVDTPASGFDFFELSDANGKILIKGNNGVSLASGLNYYYQNFCKVEITEQACQTNMPDALIPIGKTIRKETDLKTRYAFNYCTLNYTFSFSSPEDFQKELDWCALSGINLVLDLAGLEAVWTKFLMEFGYSFDEAKDWLTGPGYYAWQFMSNMESFGGPISDAWMIGRVEMARKQQRWNRSMGIHNLLQGYAGMLPTNFNEYQPDVPLLEQGIWCDLDRPAMLRTDTTLFQEYAQLFFETQEYVFGKTSNYYAFDPFHEGGIRPKDLTDKMVAESAMEAILSYNPNGVWVIQCWWDNPTDALLDGLGANRADHALLLDLNAVKTPGYIARKNFKNTPWVWCLLENFGENPGMHGDLRGMINSIYTARKNSNYMTGIGTIAEGQYNNPVVYQLLFAMTWETEPLNLEDWLDGYVERRYGAQSDSAREAWAWIEKTFYRTHIFTLMGIPGGPSIGSYPDGSGTTTLPYKLEEFYNALTKLTKDFDKLCHSEGYVYDLADFLRQYINAYIGTQFNDILFAQSGKDLPLFMEKKYRLLRAASLLDQVQGMVKDQMVGEWIGKADDWAADMDDYSKEMLPLNAKTLITTWSNAVSILNNYALRHYSGMIKDVFMVRWGNYLDKIEQNIRTDATVEYASLYEFYAQYWDWIMNTPEYSRTPTDSPDEVREIVTAVLNSCEGTDYAGNLAFGKPVTASHSAYGTDPKVLTDGVTYANQYWDGGEYANKPYAIVDLENVLNISSIVVHTVYGDTRYYNYTVEVSTDGESWTQVAERTSKTPATGKGDTFLLDNMPVRYIKVTGLYNSANEGFHINEISAYGYSAPKIYGDSNGDGLVEAIDALAMLKHAVQINTLVDDAFIFSDVDLNGKVDAIDALNTLKYSVDLIETLPIIAETPNT